MNTLPVIKSLTMSSREIAELTEKEHKNVLADIRKMLNELGKAEAEFSATAFVDGPNNSKREIEIFLLPKRETLILISGYSTVLRAKIIDRWQELEEQAAAQANKVAAATTWDQQRQAGKEVRANFTNTLENHGVSGFGFAQCTNGIYKPLFGATASKLKAQKGLAKKDSLRDAMSGEELIASSFAEIVASQRMDANQDQGNSPCYKTCKSSGEAVVGLLVKKLN